MVSKKSISPAETGEAVRETTVPYREPFGPLCRGDTFRFWTCKNFKLDTVAGREAGALSVSNRRPRKAGFLESKRTGSPITLVTTGRHVPFREEPGTLTNIALAVRVSAGGRTELTESVRPWA